MLNNLHKSDRYLTINNVESKNYHKNLVLLYQPILGTGAIGIYQTLLLDDLKNDWSSINRMCLLTQKTLPKIINYFQKLINFKLITIFVKTKDNKQDILIKINKPLSLAKFKANNLYWEQLQNRINSNELKKITQQWENLIIKSIKIDEFVKINPLNEYSNIKKNQNINSALIKYHNIDITKTIAKINNLAIVYNTDSDAVLNVISEISENDLFPHWSKINQVLFSQWQNLNKNDNLNFLDKISLIKKLSVTNFISMRLNKPLTLLNIKLITELNEIDISNDLKNLVIDFSIIKNNKIVNKYIVKILNTIVQLNITDLQVAINYLKQAYVANKKSKIITKPEIRYEQSNIFENW